MTSDHGSTPSDDGHDRSSQQPEPVEQDASAYWTPPPRPVTIASVLWICLGWILAISTVYYVLNPQSPALSGGLVAPALLVGVAVAFIVLGKHMRQGNIAARIALTVLGAMSLIGIWTVLFVVPAIVLQFLPGSSAWFQAVNRRPA
ncbi:hypothetical protein ACIBHY_36225 [Nonomuraea sp. NPDC050547]|uniref:hypothetical protein n=1 Tax=Nonomuraea sp. NPDC050547 TaxID=3364368 RepID=UPI00379B6FB6